MLLRGKTKAKLKSKVKNESVRNTRERELVGMKFTNENYYKMFIWNLAKATPFLKKLCRIFKKKAAYISRLLSCLQYQFAVSKASNKHSIRC